VAFLWNVFQGVLRDLSKSLPVAAGGQQQLMLHPQQVSELDFQVVMFLMCAVSVCE